MNYCKKCLNPDTRPQVYFNEEGICGACLWEEEKKTINWNKRKSQLLAIANMAKGKAHKYSTHDCVIGVSGGKDSTFQALYARDVLGLNPLLVSAFPDDITYIGVCNFGNLVSKGFDCIRIYVNPLLLADLMRNDFSKFCHFRKATEYPLWASVYTVAKEKNIPLVIQGENAALTQGVSIGMNTDWDASTIHKTSTIADATAYEHYSYVDKKYLGLYQFPDLRGWKGTAIWLNYYVKEWSPRHNAEFSKKHGLRFREDIPEYYGSTHPWTCLDSRYHSVSQMHKYYKHGFGYTTDCVSYDIRENLMTREEGFKLIKKYDGLCSREMIQEFCNFVGITEKEHWNTVAKFKKYDLWNRWKEQTEGIL